jgi:hypothetical protein
VLAFDDRSPEAVEGRSPCGLEGSMDAMLFTPLLTRVCGVQPRAAPLLMRQVATEKQSMR